MWAKWSIGLNVAAAQTKQKPLDLARNSETRAREGAIA
jgi:hypothetical protein